MTASDPGGLTILTTKYPLMATKRFTWHPSGVWLKKSYDKAKEFYYGAVWEMVELMTSPRPFNRLPPSRATWSSVAP